MKNGNGNQSSNLDQDNLGLLCTAAVGRRHENNMEDYVLLPSSTSSLREGRLNSKLGTESTPLHMG